MALLLLVSASCTLNETVTPDRPAWLTIEQHENDWHISRPIHTEYGGLVTMYQDGEMIKTWCQSTTSPDQYVAWVSGADAFVLDVKIDGKSIWQEKVDAITQAD